MSGSSSTNNKNSGPNDETKILQKYILNSENLEVKTIIFFDWYELYYFFNNFNRNHVKILF